MYCGGVKPGWWAAGVGKYIAESPKQGSKRGNSITKTIYSTLPILLYYLSMVGSYRDKRAHLHQFMLTVTVNNKVKQM